VLGIVPGEVDQLSRDLREHSSIDIEHGPMTRLAESMQEADIVIHASPVGMSPNTSEALIEEEMIRPGQCVFDIVYNPLETELLRRARRAGATAIPGLGMFVHQAALQFQLWTGGEPPVEIMEQVVRDALAGDPR
jgi:shikimate dehydrogenase